MTPAMRRAFAAAEAAGLRPIADPVLEAILTECPHCHAGESDPDGIWRPLLIACHAPPVRIQCRAGCTSTAVDNALRQPPTDWRQTAAEWEALAHELLQIATGLARLLDRGTRAPSRSAIAA